MIIRNEGETLNWQSIAELSAEWSGNRDVVLSIELVRSLLQITIPKGYFQAFDFQSDGHPDFEFARALLFERKLLREKSSEDLKTISRYIFFIENMTGGAKIMNIIVPPKHVLMKAGVNSYLFKNVLSLYLKNSLRQMRKAIRIIGIFVLLDRKKILQIKNLNKLNRWRKQS